MTFVLAFLLFAVTHSLFASHRFKSAIITKMPSAQFWYRSVYNLISVLSLGFVWFTVPVDSAVWYHVSAPLNWLFHGIQAIGLLGLAWSARHFGGGTFMGIQQLKDGILHKDRPYFLDEPDSNKLVFNGPFKYVRHPLYFFSLLILIFHPYMNLKWGLFTICSLLYFWLGSYPEEQKLEERFGKSYKNYQKQVPRLFPIPGKRLKQDKVL